MWHDGKLPVLAEQLLKGSSSSTRQRIQAIGSRAIYARVPSLDQKANLERRLAKYASQERLTAVRSVSENGSG